MGQLAAIIQSPEGWMRFTGPAQVVEAQGFDQVESALQRVEQIAAETGQYGVGFLTYEAAGAFGLPIAGQPALPIVWFGFFQDMRLEEPLPGAPAATYRVGSLKPSVDLERFRAIFGRIREELAAGTTYQVNYTFKMRGTFEGDPEGLFRDLVWAQRGNYSAFLSIGTHAVCSGSPELYFERRGSEIVARPMKGTARRGRTTSEDRIQRDRFQISAKQRAENVMIVDMVRNDLGRVADVGTVQVPQLFAIERYPNVWQMTSTITAQTHARFAEVIRALHPSASVTGAPKSSTMQIIADMEAEPRGVYTGAIGYIAPDGTARFNVAIRTAVIDLRAGSVEFGIGSGIVWDSEADAEYDECLLKGSVFGARVPQFELLETMRWNPMSGFFLLDRHLSRLRDSADYFGVPFSLDAALSALARGLVGQSSIRRVRLLLAPDGAYRVEHHAHEPSGAPVRVRFAAKPVDEADIFLFHKTTHREVYEQMRMDGVDELLLWNRRKEVTEATTANIVIKLGDTLLTPPIECGLLAGTFRAELIARGAIREQVLSKDDVRRADDIWLINSVHEWRAVELL
jgi:para-aminobenzoate synthetase/4-amino-4-deoxychorismate lyase